MISAFRSAGWGAGILALLALLTLFTGVRALQAIREEPEGAAAIRPLRPADLSILGRFDPFFRDGPDVASDELPVTALPLILKGVRFDPASGRGVAFIAGADGMQQVHALGEAVTDGVTLARIEPDHVVLDSAGTLEGLWLDQAAGPAPVGLPPAASSGPAPGTAVTNDGQGDVVVEPPSAGNDASGDEEP